MKSLQAGVGSYCVVNRLSLAHPEVAFTLLNDGHRLTQTSGTGDLVKYCQDLWFDSLAKNGKISNSDLDFEISGYVRLLKLIVNNYITILINRRYIKNFLLNRAILMVMVLNSW